MVGSGVIVRGPSRGPADSLAQARPNLQSGAPRPFPTAILARMTLLRLVRALSRDLSALRFGPPVTHVYDPLEYAAESVADYLERYGQPGPRTLLLGMNPGPWGMVQTGVPFGEVSLVRDWLGVRGAIGKPADEHPKRPVTGFECTRSEVSGQRLWGWGRDRYGTAEAFFERFFVWNWCPLAFMEESGRNRTPDKLPAAEREPLYERCDRALAEVVDLLGPARVVGVGKFAEKRAAEALVGRDVPIGTILHPSPASPAANRGWVEQIEPQLVAQGVEL